jgi:hypothetical protein
VENQQTVQSLILGFHTNTGTDRRTDGQMDRRTDGHTWCQREVFAFTFPKLSLSEHFNHEGKNWHAL